MGFLISHHPVLLTGSPCDPTVFNRFVLFSHYFIRFAVTSNTLCLFLRVPFGVRLASKAVLMTIIIETVCVRASTVFARDMLQEL
jgi:hypothetical protein